jgi:hypothetical protein
MIQGNQTWTSALGQTQKQAQKQALYIFTIPAFGIILSSFSPSLIQSAGPGGYGVTLYGIGGYGT